MTAPCSSKPVFFPAGSFFSRWGQRVPAPLRFLKNVQPSWTPFPFRIVFQGLSQPKQTKVCPLGLLSFLCILLDDSSFRVVLRALEVIHLLALGLGDQIQAFLSLLLSAEVLGNKKLAFLQHSPAQWLMKAAHPQQVLGLLLQHNLKAHEEVVNVVALFTYSAEQLDMAKLASGLNSSTAGEQEQGSVLLWWSLPLALAKPPCSSRHGCCRA